MGGILCKSKRLASSPGEDLSVDSSLETELRTGLQYYEETVVYL